MTGLCRKNWERAAVRKDELLGRVMPAACLDLIYTDETQHSTPQACTGVEVESKRQLGHQCLAWVLKLTEV